MISRLILNLRDPSLLSSGRRASFNTSPAELTYAITTIVEVEHPTQCSEGTPDPGLAPARSHTVYHWLAKEKRYSRCSDFLFDTSSSLFTLPIRNLGANGGEWVFEGVSKQGNKLSNGEIIGLDCCRYYGITFRWKFEVCSLSSHSIEFTILGSYIRIVHCKDVSYTVKMSWCILVSLFTSQVPYYLQFLW